MAATIEDYKVALQRFADPKEGMKQLIDVILEDDYISFRDKSAYVTKIMKAYEELEVVA